MYSCSMHQFVFEQQQHSYLCRKRKLMNYRGCCWMRNCRNTSTQLLAYNYGTLQSSFVQASTSCFDSNTSSANAFSHRIVPLALLSWLTLTITTSGSDIAWGFQFNIKEKNILKWCPVNHLFRESIIPQDTASCISFLISMNDNNNRKRMRLMKSWRWRVKIFCLFQNSFLKSL